MWDLLVFAFINLLGAMSPGPDFAVVMRYGLTGSRRAALYTSLGVAAALLIHVTYCVSGVALLLASSPFLFRAFRILGALYIGYLGVKILFESRSEVPPDTVPAGKSAFMAGFLTNLLNPKASVFLLSLFTQFAGAMQTIGWKIAYGFTIPFIALAWFSTLSYMITHPFFLPFLLKHRRAFMVIMGSVLCLLALWGLITSL